jgi:hypothetical protein
MRVTFYFFGELQSDDEDYFQIGAQIGGNGLFVGITFSPETWLDALKSLLKKD